MRAPELTTRLVRTVGVLVDLVLPSSCAGCEVDGAGQLCAACRSGLIGLEPTPTAPTPSPPGLPPCVALGAYEGPLRGLVLHFKERGAYRLARPLGEQLARAVVRASGRPAGSPIVVIPVPSTAAAIRERHGDHMARIARHTVRQLGQSGWPAAAAGCLTARAKADSSHLTALGRAEAATDAFRVRPSAVRRVAAAQHAGASVIIVDDILTTGVTMAAVAIALASVGVRIDGAATIAATRRRVDSPDRVRFADTRPDVGFSP
jgi:predicted amidophosphoribosyltransferase